MPSMHDFWLDREACIAQGEARDHPEPSDYEPEPKKKRIPKYWEEGLDESAYISGTSDGNDS